MNIKLLNEERKKQKLTVNELAEKANLPKSTIEKILFGIVKNPRLDTVQAIERALGLSWTDEEKAMGVGTHAIVLSEEDAYRLNLLAKREELLGAS